MLRLSVNQIRILFIVIAISTSSILINSKYYDGSSETPPLVALVRASEQIDNQDVQQSSDEEDNNYYNGVNVRGIYTSLQHERYPSTYLPLEGYYDKSFKLISQAGMNHIRYVFYWEAYERYPQLFMKELAIVANYADKWELAVLYDNHQYHTSSWLDPKNGTGFPEDFFRGSQDAVVYKKGSGGETRHESAKIWWSRWWDRTITDAEGNDGWNLQAGFLKKVVQEVDEHKSTVGYEILNEPQVHKDSQWSQVGTYNTFIVDKLRKLTEKTIAYSQQIPTSFKNSPISITPENIAKMAPNNKTNVVFEFTMYGEPIPDTYQGNRFITFVNAAELAGVPKYIGEWNNVKREKVNDDESTIIYEINSEKSGLSQKQAVGFLEEFEEADLWGWAYWNWNIIPGPAPNMDLITFTGNGDIRTTIYYDVLKHAISEVSS